MIATTASQRISEHRPAASTLLTVSPWLRSVMHPTLTICFMSSETESKSDAIHDFWCTNVRQKDAVQGQGNEYVTCSELGYEFHITIVRLLPSIPSIILTYDVLVGTLINVIASCEQPR